MKRPIDPRTIELPDDRVVAILRGKAIAERAAIVFACNRTMRLRLAGHLRTRHADWSDEQIAAEIARRMSCGAV
ncbi:MAG TPA: hypothetical protein VHY91_16225 [Pirellulales bacterium]|jgi:hypothetical protein|nr:hypothetical protein [Pirellulales bacterium]